jgi:hypothetical protein
MLTPAQPPFQALQHHTDTCCAACQPPAETDTSWHGGCLAIAELARRSILSPDLLGQVADLLTAALTYDVRRGPHSIGAHVRDAAAYVCWALARSYEPCQLSDCVHKLAASLLVITCYDREVNCRRAAAAAFQESVGRLGSFPHGLEILAVADYYSVGNMVSAYLWVAPFVAQFKEYTQVGGPAACVGRWGGVVGQMALLVDLLLCGLQLLVGSEQGPGLCAAVDTSACLQR